MKPLSELTHYEILEVDSEAEREEIERAYHIARAAYADDSVGLYSIYDDDETEAIRERVEAAWRVLSSEEARREYDAGLARAQPRPEPPLELDLQLEPEKAPPLRDPVHEGPTLEEFADLEAEEEGEYDGARLRRSRLRRGMDVEQVATITKVNPTYLRCIEEEAFDQLPAAVYVRGFVSAYARTVGLDPAEVAPSYMARFLEAREEKRPARVIGRR